MRLDDQTTKYAQRGIAASIPGIMNAIEILQAELAEMRRTIGEMEPAEPKLRSKASRGRPVGTSASSGWSEDPEERSREMKRRQAVAKRNAAKKAKAPTVKLTQPNHPRNVDHPDHAKWVKKLRKVQIQRWNAMTAAERQERQDKMQAGRKVA